MTHNSATMAELPDLLSLSPKMAHRAWMKWLSDTYPLDGRLIQEASGVGMAITEWDLNQGKAAEEISRKNLEDRLTKFRESCARTAD